MLLRAVDQLRQLALTEAEDCLQLKQHACEVQVWPTGPTNSHNRLVAYAELPLSGTHSYKSSQLIQHISHNRLTQQNRRAHTHNTHVSHNRLKQQIHITDLRNT